MSERVIYFLELVGTGKVKIGKSKCLANRLRQYRLHYDPSQQLRLLKTIPGYTAEEIAIQARFAEHCVDPAMSKEWFWLEPIREQIMGLVGIEIDMAQTANGRGSKPDKRITVVSDVCGHEKETWARHAADAKRRACRVCSGKLNWERLSEEDRKAQVQPWREAGQARGHQTRTRNALKRWKEECLPIAQANAVCVECGAVLSLLSHHGYSKKPDGVNAKRRCLRCGVSHGMFLAWQRPDYLSKMVRRRTRESTRGPDIVKLKGGIRRKDTPPTDPLDAQVDQLIARRYGENPT